MARQGVSILADMSQAGELVGMMKGTIDSIAKNSYLSAVVQMAHSRMAQDFDMAMDAVHATHPDNFQHVYEWDKSGGSAAGGRLWRHTFSGSGAMRNASFVFIPSVKPIPTPEERMSNSNDPISNVDPAVIAKLSKRSYIFVWKAEVMEYNLPVDIIAKNAMNLFIPTTDFPRGYVFKPQVRGFRPGGQMTTGMFNSFWETWWNTGANVTFNDKVKNIIERDIENQFRFRARSPKGTFISSEVHGREMATKYMAERAVNYRRASSYVRAL